MNNPFLARFNGTEVLAHEGSASQVMTLLNAMVEHEHASVVMNTEFASTEDFWTELGGMTKYVRPYAVKDGILQIPVKGVMLKDFPYQFFGYATGYEYIRAAFDRGLADPEVKGIAMIFDTPGGMVAGNFDLVDHIHSKRGVKPIAGFAQEHAYSAGYSLISAVDPGRVNVARTGGVGSIGVVTSHVDYSEAMEKAGIKVTFIHAGKHKVEGNPYEALSDEAKARIQSRIDGLYNIFVSTVARNRGMDEQAVRNTEALTFSAEEAVSNGLADNIGSLEDAIVAFATSMSTKEDDKMSFTQEQLDAAVATATASAKTEGHNEGAVAERTRISAIVNSEAGAKRPKAALKMATNEKFAAVDSEAIVEMLAELPEEKAEVAAPTAPKGKEGAAADFATAMNNAEHPQAGAPAEMTDEQKARERRRAAAAAAGRLKAAE